MENKLKQRLVLNFVLVLILGYLILISGFFWFYPKIDLKVEAFFWDKNFIFLNSPWVFWANGIRHILNFLVWLCVGLSFVGLIFGIKNKKFKVYKKHCLYIFLCFAIAPGLLINEVLKNHWGQPRPVEIKLFNGSMDYQKDWVISKQCPTNCAFVCGDCAAAFVFMAFVPLVSNRKKKILLATVIILGSGLISLIRLAQGGHFLSDVLLAYGLDALVIYLIYRKVFS